MTALGEAEGTVFRDLAMGLAMGLPGDSDPRDLQQLNVDAVTEVAREIQKGERSWLFPEKGPKPGFSGCGPRFRC